MILRFSFLGGYFLFYSFILVLNIVGDHVVDFLLFVYVSFNPFIYVLQLRATGRPSCFQSSVRNISKYRGFLSSEVCIIFHVWPWKSERKFFFDYFGFKSSLYSKFCQLSWQNCYLGCLSKEEPVFVPSIICKL
jgi:hypothetical protein